MTRERTRVLFVVASMAGGGAERIVTELVTHLDPTIFDARAGVLWRDGPYLAHLDEQHLLVPRRMQGWIQYRDRPKWWQLLPSLAMVPIQQHELLARFRPHIVVTVTKSMNLAARASLAVYGRRQVAWVVREGNNTGAMIDYEAPSGAAKSLQNLAVRGTYRRADRVVAISDGVASGLARRFQLDRTRLLVIHNAIDIDRISRQAQEPPSIQLTTPFVVAAGRLEHQKGFDVLIRAHARHLADRGVALVILGEGTARPALAALAASLGIAARVSLPGFVDNPWAVFSRAAVFVCASRWEGFGNVIVEAMAAGTPVVSTDCDFGPREILQDGHAGRLVTVDDAEALGVAVASLLDDRDARTTLAAAGTVRARAFDVPAMVAAYSRLFRELVP